MLEQLKARVEAKQAVAEQQRLLAWFSVLTDYCRVELIESGDITTVPMAEAVAQWEHSLQRYGEVR